MRNKLYEIKFFELCSKKMELMKQIYLFKKGLVIFLKGAIQIHFPLLWRIFFN